MFSNIAQLYLTGTAQYSTHRVYRQPYDLSKEYEMKGQNILVNRIKCLRKNMDVFYAVAMAVMYLLAVSTTQASGMSASLTQPAVDSKDIANYGSVTGSDKWWTGTDGSAVAMGQTFTTGNTAVWLNALTYRIANGQKAEPTKTYVVRVGTVYGDVFTEIFAETLTQDFTWDADEYMTWSFSAPVLLAPGIEYGIDVAMASSTTGWTTGIPYIEVTGNEYGGGTRYASGGDASGDTAMYNATGDRIFHIDLDAADATTPGYTSPQNGATISGGSVDLSWANLLADTASDVWVDVWFGTDPDALAKVVDAGLNTTSTTVTISVDDTYYWRIDSYLDGSSSGTPDQGALLTFYVNDSAEPALIAALTGLMNHVLGSPTLDEAAIAAHKATIDTNKTLFKSSYEVMVAAFDLVQTYDTTSGFGPLWIEAQPPSRDKFDEKLESTMYFVMQYIMDYTYSNANLAQNEALLDGFKFDCSKVFPGAVAPPSSVVTHTATINASYPVTAGWERLGDTLPARKPTGTYLAPGSVATVTVPSALVNSGYRVRVGAHSWDNANRTPNKRLERSSIEYQIDSTTIKVANPLGGGIYIEVPYRADNGIVTVDIIGAVRSPYFSAKSFHMTTLTEWQDVERHHPAPWADFQTEKYMTQVPTAWIYAFDDPVTGMANWDLAVDTYNDLMGFPRERGKETIYTQVDVINRSSVFAPGYPAVNVSDSDPTSDAGGNVNTHLTKGQQIAPSVCLHEHGHAYFFPKFGGEMESTVNLPHAAVWNQCFGYDLDTAFAGSLDFDNNPNRTLDNTAVAWMTSFNFSPRNVPMHSAEKAYQLKGHAKYVDTARLFGWQVLNDFWKTFVDDYEATGLRDTTTDDQKIMRLSKATGVDLRPLLHFWGTQPVDAAGLAAEIAAEGLPASAAIYDTIVHYKALVPSDNSEFRTFATGWWGKQPSINGYWTEREHSRQWDTEELFGEGDQQRPEGEIYVEATAIDIEADIDLILAMYFPAGRPGDDDTTPPTPNPATFASALAVDSDTAISMTATTGSDTSGVVEYFFTCVAGGGHDSNWQTSPSYTDRELSAGVQYSYTVIMRDGFSNTGTASDAASATTAATPDNDPPTPDPMTWESLPVALSSSSISMTATTAVDTNGVEYYFSNVTDGSHDSDWRASPTYIDMGLAPDTHYSYTVKARDMSVSYNETALSAVAGVSTGLDLSMEVPFMESFESYTNGHSLGGSNGWLDENAHVSTDSALISALLAYENAGNDFPINVTHEKVMDVALGGSITKLFNDVGNGTTLYSDFLLMPTYGSDAPSPLEGDALLGINVGSSGNIFVWHSYLNPVNSQVSNEWHKLSASVTADVWTRITLAQDYVNHMYQLRINGGLAVTDPKGLSMVGGVPGGSWFKMAAEPGNLSELIVRNGNLDDMVVTSVPPEGAIASAGTRAFAAWVNTYGGNPALSNQDGDGLTLDQEYLIETDPTVSNEFKIVAVGITHGNTPYLWYNANGLPNGTLSVSNRTDLVSGSVDDLEGDLSFIGGNVVEWIGTEPMSTNGFMRIHVR